MTWSVEQRFIDDAQRELGVRFPRVFMARLRKQNGGDVRRDGHTWTFHPVGDTSERRRLSRTSNDIVRETRFARQHPDFPAAAVAIAVGASGPERLVLLPSEEDPGVLAEDVYDWDPAYGLAHVADTVVEFLLSEPEEDEAD